MLTMASAFISGCFWLESVIRLIGHHNLNISLHGLQNLIDNSGRFRADYLPIGVSPLFLFQHSESAIIGRFGNFKWIPTTIDIAHTAYNTCPKWQRIQWLCRI